MMRKTKKFRSPVKGFPRLNDNSKSKGKCEVPEFLRKKAQFIWDKHLIIFMNYSFLESKLC